MLKNKEKSGKRKFVLELLSPYKKYIVLLLVLSFFAAALDGISIGMLVPLLSGIQQIKNYGQLPQILQSIINIFASFSLEKQILLSLAIVVLALVLKNLVLAVFYYIAYWLTAKTTENLRGRVVDTMMSVGIGFFNTVKTGELVENIIYNTMLTDEAVRKSIEIISQIMSFILLLALLVIFSWKLTGVTIVLSAVIALGVSIYIKDIPIRSETHREREGAYRVPSGEPCGDLCNKVVRERKRTGPRSKRSNRNTRVQPAAS